MTAQQLTLEDGLAIAFAAYRMEYMREDVYSMGFEGLDVAEDKAREAVLRAEAQKRIWGAAFDANAEAQRLREQADGMYLP
jgi:hypothetical protein